MKTYLSNWIWVDCQGSSREAKEVFAVCRLCSSLVCEDFPADCAGVYSSAFFRGKVLTSPYQMISSAREGGGFVPYNVPSDCKAYICIELISLVVQVYTVNVPLPSLGGRLPRTRSFSCLRCRSRTVHLEYTNDNVSRRTMALMNRSIQS